MNIIPSTITNKFGKQLLTLQKHSPRLLFGLGIGGVVVSTVMACRATLKLEETLDESQDKIHAVNVHREMNEIETYSESQFHKDMLKAKAGAAVKVVRLYAPSAVVGAAAIGALTGSHVTLVRRNDALAAAYATVQASFNAYRDRVKAELGEDREKELRYDVQDHKTKGKNGEVVKVAQAPDFLYSRFFDEENRNWKPVEEQNRFFLEAQQRYFNQLLHARGHVFLNEVYDSLGYERSKAGQAVGWLSPAMYPKGAVDGHIDFGLYSVRNAENIANGENQFILDFNVDGAIWDKI
jgi:hypothetical protein